MRGESFSLLDSSQPILKSSLDGERSIASGAEVNLLGAGRARKLLELLLSRTGLGAMSKGVSLFVKLIDNLR